MANQYVNKVVNGETGDVIIDISGDTLITADQLASGVKAHARTGAPITGTITNIAADHAIVVTDAGPKMYVKQDGTWVTVTKAYRKVSGSWQEVALADAFSSSGKYVVG